MKFSLLIIALSAASAVSLPVITNQADIQYQQFRQEAAKVVDTQEKFEATKTAEVAKDYAADIAKTKAYHEETW